MTERLDLPALGAFLRSTALTIAAADSTSPSQQHASQRLDAALWLELLAAVLGCSSAWLLESGRVNALDLAERSRIGAAARLIRSHDWEPPPSQSSVKPSEPRLHISAETMHLAWRTARDTYLNHILACRACRAHRLNHPYHCAVGAELRQRYDHECHQSPLKS